MRSVQAPEWFPGCWVGDLVIGLAFGRAGKQAVVIFGGLSPLLLGSSLALLPKVLIPTSFCLTPLYQLVVTRNLSKFPSLVK